MKTVQVVEAKATLSALLDAVEGGETIAITRRGRVIARLVPEKPRMAADIFRPLWSDAAEIDLAAPPDRAPDPIEPF
ncbi:MAG: type II toxin-antitoxin system prevent-host-death family antitoxin [Thiohalocapsa sp.]|jgi:prevent-host-death family protein|nr:type II toxin-antitoxin system prevent-host-death family antitoxin [Thiohalocapsa sp.]